MKKFLAIICIFPLFASAQLHLEVETDPLAWALGGGSIHAAAAWGKQRVQIGYAFLPLPEGFQSFPEVKESFNTISGKWDYFFSKRGSEAGFFAGVTLDNLFYQYELEDEILKESIPNIGVRIGYKFDLFPNRDILSGFYLTPWVGLSYLAREDAVELGGQSYSFPKQQVFPTVHLGYRF
ncbi:MAG: hypothetical protein AAFN10_05265 [Bacteroidota bacterium]